MLPGVWKNVLVLVSTGEIYAFLWAEEKRKKLEESKGNLNTQGMHDLFLGSCLVLPLPGALSPKYPHSHLPCLLHAFAPLLPARETSLSHTIQQPVLLHTNPFYPARFPQSLLIVGFYAL